MSTSKAISIPASTKKQFCKISGNQHLNVVGKQAIQVSGTHSLKVSGHVADVFSHSHSESVSMSLYLKVGTGIVIEDPIQTCIGILTNSNA